MAIQADRVGLRPGEAPIGVLLKRGLLAGLAGGVAMAGFLVLVGESSIRRALVIEAAHPGGEPADEVFSRGVQVAGGAVAALLYGLLLGAVFAVVYAATRPRSRSADPFRRALQLGAIGYVTVVLVPALKYPANPPGVGNPDTITQRTASYLTLLCASILLSVLAGRAWAWLQVRGTTEQTSRTVLVGGLWLAAVGLAIVVWPATPDAIPGTVPAQLLWRFRLASLGGALILWTTLSVCFGGAAAVRSFPKSGRLRRNS